MNCNKVLIQIISLSLLCIILSSCNNSQDRKNTADISPPKLINVEVMPENIISSGEFTVKVKADDDISGIEKVITSIFSPDDDDKKNSFDSSVSLTTVLHYNEENGYWEGKEKIEHFYESGQWVVWSISLSDYAGNDTYYHFSKDNTKYYSIKRSLNKNEMSNVKIAYLDVSKTNPDTIPPEITNIILVPKTIDRYGKIVSKAVIKEQETDVKYISLQFYNSSTVSDKLSYQNKSIIMILYKNHKTNIWEGIKNIEPHTEAGIWKTKYILVKDLAGNERKYLEEPAISKTHYVYNNKNDKPIATDLELLSFRVINTNKDKQKPKLTEIKLTPKVINLSGKVRITADFIDKGSGIKNASISLYSPSKQKDHTSGSPYVFIHLKLNPVSEKWEGETLLEPYHEKGTWELSRIFIKDYAGNSIRYYVEKDDEKSSKYLYKDSSGKIVKSDFDVLSVIKK